jgi:hypothetical protein
MPLGPDGGAEVRDGGSGLVRTEKIKRSTRTIKRLHCSSVPTVIRRKPSLRGFLEMSYQDTELPEPGSEIRAAAAAMAYEAKSSPILPLKGPQGQRERTLSASGST